MKKRKPFKITAWARVPVFRKNLTADDIAVCATRGGFFGRTYKHERIIRVRITEI